MGSAGGAITKTAGLKSYLKKIISKISSDRTCTIMECILVIIQS